MPKRVAVRRARFGLRRAVAVVLTLGLGATALAGCDGAPDAALARSSDPIFLPAVKDPGKVAFTIYETWTNQYELRYNQSIGATDNFVGIQFGPRSRSEASGNSPTNAMVSQARDAWDDQECPEVDNATRLRFCVHEDQSWLVREFAHDGEGYALVVAYFDNPLAAAGDERADSTRFNPESTEARVMLGAFDAVPLDDAVTNHLEVIS